MIEIQELEKPYWQCVCGVKTKTLTDEIVCNCSDIYEQDWKLIKLENVFKSCGILYRT